MSHLIQPAASGRSSCRGCGARIARGELRFGERLANPFGEGEMTLWFHPLCAAFKRPEPLLQTLAEAPVELPDRDVLERAARESLAQPRLVRIDGAERAPRSQATCRHCRQPIERGAWRIRLVFFEEGRFAPGGFVHLDCRRDYFGTDEVGARVLHFSGSLDPAEREALQRAFERPEGPARKAQQS